MQNVAVKAVRKADVESKGVNYGKTKWQKKSLYS